MNLSRRLKLFPVSTLDPTPTLESNSESRLSSDVHPKNHPSIRRLVRSRRNARRAANVDATRSFRLESALQDRGSSAPPRSDLIARVRREIMAGTYDTPERFAQALDRLADCLAAD